MRMNGNCFTRGLVTLAVLALTVAGFPRFASSREVTSQLPMLQLVRELQTPGPTSAVIWSSDGTKLAALSYGSPARLPGGFLLASPFGSLITVWNADGSVVRELHRPKPFFQTQDTFAFAGGNTQIVAPPSEESHDLGFSVFDIASGEIVREVPGAYPDQVRSVNAAIKLATSSDQSILAVAFGRGRPQPVALYSTRDWSKLGDLPEGPTAGPGIGVEQPKLLAFSSDAQLLAVERVDNLVLVYDMSMRQVVQRFKSYPPGDVATAMAFSPDGRMIAVAGTSFAVRVFRVSDGREIAHPIHTEPISGVYGLAWSPIGQGIAYITNNHSLHLWAPLRPEIGKQTIELGEKVESDSIVFSPDGKMLAACVGRSVLLFRVSE
jgi:WD40 repeat protein